MLHRRHFLKSTAAAIAALILPHRLFARTAAPRFHFLRTDTKSSWSVPDPELWVLANQNQPILERAAEGLGKLTPSDGDRIVRLVLRRCRLNLLELHGDQVVVHHWGQHQADLRPFFKQHRLATKEIEVVLRDRKKEVAIKQTGDDFLYGILLAPDFPLDLFQKKWARRFEREVDDCSAVPGTSSGFAWEGVENGYIPWAAMKSAWQRSAPGVCLNCDGALILTNFGLRPVGMFNRSPDFAHVCGACRRSFVDGSINDMGAWIVASLDAEVRPDAEMVWGKRVKREATT